MKFFEIENISWFPIHVECISGINFEVINLLIKSYSDSLKRQKKDGLCKYPSVELRNLWFKKYLDSVRGSLPFHQACLCIAPLELLNLFALAYPESIEMGIKILIFLDVREYESYGNQTNNHQFDESEHKSNNQINIGWLVGWERSWQ